MRRYLMAAAVAATLATAGVAHATTTLFSYPGPSPEFASPGSAFAVFNAGAGAGDTSFRIDGYASLDGNGNCCTDVFTLNLNGTDIFSGSWDMGGGGGNVIYFGPSGATATPHSNGFFAGGYTDVFVPLNLAAGSNTLTWSYSGAAQGLGDEGWGLENIAVHGNAAGGVPEPASWAMMLMGFAGLGLVMRTRKAALA